MTRHYVTWTTGEDGGISGVSVECLADPGAWCRRGCPVPECEDWDHWGARDAGCEHCEDLCDCDCDCSDTLRNNPQWTCPGCPDALSHGGDCPHQWVDLGWCWVLDRLGDPRDDVLTQCEPTGPGQWAAVFHGLEFDELINLIVPGHPVRVIQPQGCDR